MKKQSYIGAIALTLGILASSCGKNEPVKVGTTSDLETKTKQVTLSPKAQELKLKFENGYTVTEANRLKGLWGIAEEAWSYLNNGDYSRFADGTDDKKELYAIWNIMDDSVRFDLNQPNTDKIFPDQVLHFDLESIRKIVYGTVSEN